jgi:WD40 repeat protein
MAFPRLREVALNCGPDAVAYARLDAMSELFVRCTCGSRLRLRAEHAGRVGRCACGRTVPVPAAAAFAQHAGRELTLAELDTLLAKPQPPTAAPSPAAGLWRPGAVVDGRYEVKGKLGEGTFGAVWHARDREHQQDLAVKELRPDKQASPQRRRNFLREARVWIVDLGMHPHVVRAWWTLELEGTPYLFLEYCGGGSLAQRTAQGKTRDLATALDLGIQLCWGLAHCHGKGVVHRDFKPLNVLLTAKGEAKLTDFGTVKFAALETHGESDGPEVVSDLRRTAGGHLQGTPPYMPPEQWARGATVDFHADLYALGVTLFELLTGAFPIQPAERTLAGWARAHAETKPASLRALRPETPEALERVVQQCLAKRPGERPAGAAAVARTLRDIYARVAGATYPREEPREAELLADSRNNIGLSLTVMEEHAEAEKAWQEALRVDPHHPEATYNGGLLQWRSARLTDQKLLERLGEVRASAADAVRVDYLLGLVHLERADARAAVHLLGKAAEAKPDQAQITSAVALAQSIRDPSDELPRALEGHTNCVDSVAWSPDGRRALSGSWDKTLRLWDVRGGICVRTFEGHTRMVTSVAWSPDGRLALSASDDSTVRLWEFSSGQCLRTFDGHALSVSWSPDGTCALSGGAARTLQLWEVSSSRCLRTFERHGNCVNSVAWSPDGRFALSASADATLRLWDVSSGQCLRTFDGHTDEVKSVSWSPDGRFALSGSRDATLRLWDVFSGRCLRILDGHTSMVSSVSWSSDGHVALSGGGQISLGDKDRTLRLWEVSSGRCLRTFEGHARNVTAVSWSPDGRFALSGSGDCTLRLWRITIPKQSVPLATSTAFAVHSALYHHLLQQVRDSLRTNPAVAAGFLRKAKQQPGCSRRADGLELGRKLSRRLAHRRFVGGWEKHTLEGHTASVTTVAWGPDSRLALSGSVDTILRLWDVSGSTCLRTFEGHPNSVTAVSWSPDGRFALSGSADATLCLWDVSSGHCLRTFEGHANCVTSGAWSPDGRFALSGSEDNTMRLWEVSSGQCLRTFEGPTGPVYSVSWSPDGCRLLSGSWDHMLRLWEPDWEFELNQPADWDEGARPFLVVFLTIHTSQGIVRRGKPSWTEDDFRRLLDRLGCAGYGWLRPEGVRHELEKMAGTWQGPPLLGRAQP